MADKEAEEAEKAKAVADLEKQTRFTEAELKDLVEYGWPSLSREAAYRMMSDSGIKTKALQDRMWDVFDRNDDQTLRIEEVILALNSLQRGTPREVTEFFFRMYDLNHDKQLSQEEVVEVYKMVLHDVAHVEITREVVDRLARFVKEADKNHDGQLNYEEFDAAVQNFLSKRETPTKDGKYWLTFLALMFVTSWFEMGTSFGLPVPAALAAEFKERFSVTDSLIGLLSGAYFAAAIVGPPVGGWAMQKMGAVTVLNLANTVVLVGCLLQALAQGEYGFWLLLIGRLLLGFGGEMTPFLTIECLSVLFPDHFMFMAGFRNLIQSASGALAFIIIPALSRAYPDTSAVFYLPAMFPVLMGIVALASGLIVVAYVRKKQEEIDARPPRASKVFAALANKITPRPPWPCAEWKMPAAFYLSIYGIKSIYFPPFAFTTFTIMYFSAKYDGIDAATAATMTSLIHLIGGITGPFFGPLSDWLGHRALVLGLFASLSALAFVLFALFSEPIVAWIGVLLLALAYGFGDTVAYASVRLIVGPRRAGLGYGVYGIIGNSFGFLAPLFAGIIIDTSTDKAYSGDLMSWYFFGTMVASMACWFGVRIMIGRKSHLELPAKEVVETDEGVVDAATLMGIAGTGTATGKLLDASGKAKGAP